MLTSDTHMSELCHTTKLHIVYSIFSYQEYVLVHDPRFLVSVPDDVTMSAACMVPCSGITAHTAAISVQGSVENAIKLNGK